MRPPPCCPPGSAQLQVSVELLDFALAQDNKLGGGGGGAGVPPPWVSRKADRPGEQTVGRPGPTNGGLPSRGRAAAALTNKEVDRGVSCRIGTDGGSPMPVLPPSLGDLKQRSLSAGGHVAVGRRESRWT